MSTLIVVAHGTRSPAGQAQIRDLVARVAARRPGLDVRLCYADVQEPRIAEVAQQTPEAVVVPLLLSAGYHVRVDIADAVAGRDIPVSRPLGPDAVLRDSLLRHLPPTSAAGASGAAAPGAVVPSAVVSPGVVVPSAVVSPGVVVPSAVVSPGVVVPSAVVSPGAVTPSAVVPSSAMRPAAVGRSGATAWLSAAKPVDAVVLAAAGSSDPAWRADVEALATDLEYRTNVASSPRSPVRHRHPLPPGVERRDQPTLFRAGEPESSTGARGDTRIVDNPRIPVRIGYVSGPGPRVADVVAELRQGGARRVAIAAYLLADGLFYRRLGETGADHVTPPLCLDPAVTELVLRRFDEVVATAPTRRLGAALRR